MHYPNPLHYDERWAAREPLRRARRAAVVHRGAATPATGARRPRSAASPTRTSSSAATSGGSSARGSGPATTSCVTGCRTTTRSTETSFAGPTCFQRGDTLYINQRGERVAHAAVHCHSLPGVARPRRRRSSTRPRIPSGPTSSSRELEARKLAFIEQIQELRHDKRLFSSVSVGDRSRRARPRAAQPGQLHHRVACLPDDDLGWDAHRADHGERRGSRVHQGDGRLRGRPSHGADQPRADRRRLLRPVARSPPAPVGAARRHGSRLRLRRVDGCLDPRLRGRVGRGVGLHRPTRKRSTAIPPSPATSPSITGEVVDTRVERRRSIAVVAVELTNQTGATMAKATVEVELPTE